MAKTKGKRYWTKKLDEVFSRYIRLKYADENGIVECITCYKRKPYKQMHAGHWIVRNKKRTRWDEQNVHPQCASCNTFYNGEPQFYQDRLLELYGQETIDRLRRDGNTPKSWEAWELEELYNQYKEKLKLIDID